ncbi:hypothetical protein R4596rev_00044 [Escherichia phage vB_EcoP_R4596]|uniref:Uncharacterized protein n=1 Tax=Escherichia phage vB_EcoP_R4596 TaxID=2508204 RepID=A0A482MRH1_9CAUD|nr:hypothetical protein R4596rev_00044 [Escherichia phage vB_EcoP_R4596]CAI8690810.1 hypothetical protein FCJLANJD_00024 [Escherichia phage vB_EcoP-CC1]CAI9889086.1 hypothetical protein LIHBEBCN_00037 [Escherichia phage vB_EcoP-CC2]
MLGVTGQRNKNVATKVVADLATAATVEELRDTHNSINRADLSGKQEGSVVLVKKEDGNYSIFVATGSKPTDVWKELSPTIPEQEMPAEYIDMVDIQIHQDSASNLRMDSSRTSLIQTPMWDTEGELLFRNTLSATCSCTILADGASGVRQDFNFKINGILEQEEQYYDIDTLMCSIHSATTTNGLTLCMPDVKSAKTNKMVVKVDTMQSLTMSFDLNFLVEWTSPTRLL